ncbi:MAG: zinc ribbon domain-containing protein [Candidatus Methylomirabilia bacterium]
MDCRSCGVVNAPGRRYCRECGARLGQACPVCHFFNGVEDKHCGGCGRRIQAGVGPLAVDAAPTPAPVPDADDDLVLVPPGRRVPPAGSAAAGLGDQGVSQSEIDGLFENILDEEPGESPEDDT